MHFDFHIHHHHNPSLEKQIMAISSEVQTALDKIRQTQSLVASVDAGLKLQSQQIADLKAQIAALPTATPLSDEDKAALVEAGNDLDAINAKLQADIPANATVTPAAPQLAGTVTTVASASSVNGTTVSASVTGNGANPITGSVQFVEDGKPIDSAKVDSTGVAAITLPDSGPHKVKAVYSGDASNAQSISDEVAVGG